MAPRTAGSAPPSGCSSFAANAMLELQCDYLVVGAGTAGMSFVDTLLTEHESATVVLVDRRDRPGGHWTTAYPFVRLHQPSCNYGVNSLRLGKASDSKGREAFDIHDRATGAEIVEYYARVAEQFKASGRVQCFFGAEYHENDGVHTIVTSSGDVRPVTCVKVVTVATKVVVPSMRKALFPVYESVNYVPVNALPDEMKAGKHRKYVILGAGKTGADAIVHLLRNGVDQSAITWVISRDVWFYLRDGLFDGGVLGGAYWKSADRLFSPWLKGFNTRDVFFCMERQGALGRLQPDGQFPEVFKSPVIDKEELTLLRSIKDAVRLGRVTSIEADAIVLDQGSVPLSSADTLIVDCMAEEMYGYNSFEADFTIFEPGRINLGPLLSLLNPSFTSAIIAYIESTFDGDRIKNSFCFFPRGKHCAFVPSFFLASIHAQLKSFEALGKHPPAMQFILNSRTNADAPKHHGGTLKLLWAALGPLKLDKKGKQIVKKVESGGFSDVKDSFGNGRSVKPVPKSAVRSKSKKGNTLLECPSYPPSIKATRGRGCCMSAEAVA